VNTIIVDKYVKGTEIEVDAIADGEDILIPGIMEHIERTGVHSGDSITVYPYITLSEEVVQKLIENTKKIAKALKIMGLVNIQYVFDGKDVYVIEVNPRASRTVPILSKVTGVPMVNLAVQIMLGKKLNEMSYGTGLMRENSMYAVKIPVFSNEKLADVDTYLGPEMKSTGEVLGIDVDLNKAIYKGFIGAGFNIETEGSIYVSLKDVDKLEGADVIKEYYDLGFKVYSSKGTGEELLKHGVQCEIIQLEKLFELIGKGEIVLSINTPTKGNNSASKGFKIRRKSAEYKVPVFTCIDTAKIFLKTIELVKSGEQVEYRPLNYYFKN
jgi:carbamoyl-phosphate synthase large subunit